MIQNEHENHVLMATQWLHVEIRNDKARSEPG